MTLFNNFCEFCGINNIKHNYNNPKFGNALENLNMSALRVRNIENQYGYHINIPLLIEQSKANCIYEMWKLEVPVDRL